MITISQLRSRFWIPTAISVLLRVVSAVVLWWAAKPTAVVPASSSSPTVAALSKV